MEQHEMSGIGNDTIAAVCTAPGVGGIAVVRISGPDAIRIADGAWRGKSLAEAATHTAHLGRWHATDGTLLDEAVATVFRAPASFTGEDTVEISVHGSRWIQREILADIIRRGARSAGPGEFTQRAFMNGKIDLAQAEGVADLIASTSRAAHRLAVSQTRGGFSRDLEGIRNQLIDFASLLELELDFSEEDVEFADRSRLLELAEGLLKRVDRLSGSYASGSALKEGVPVVIAGVPNAGKSSLLNLLLGDDKAIVSDIPGTTRDIIEDTMEINGILFRFIDTAGLRATEDTIESLGIERARRKASDARIVVWILDPTAETGVQMDELRRLREINREAGLIVLANKSDLGSEGTQRYGDHQGSGDLQGFGDLQGSGDLSPIAFSAKTGEGLERLKGELTRLATSGYDPEQELIVTNARHYESLVRAGEALRRAIEGIRGGISADFIAQDVREATHHLGTITGTVSTDTLLQTIFSRFCIGK